MPAQAAPAQVVPAQDVPVRAAPAQSEADGLVVIGVAGLRWSDVRSSPELFALVDQADAGSISVKTAGPRTCPVDGWLTIGAGTRVRVDEADGACPALPRVDGSTVPDWQRYVDQQAKYRTDAKLGKLGASSNNLCGFGPGGALATADTDGTITRWQASYDPSMLAGCNNAVIDAGVLPPREGRLDAVRDIAALVKATRDEGRRVLLVGVAEEMPGAQRQTLVALQFRVGTDEPRWLTSNSTRRPGLIQLTDVTASLFADVTPATPLDGSPIRVTGDRHDDAAAVVEDRLDTNERFSVPKPMSVVIILVLGAIGLVAAGWLRLSGTRAARRTTEIVTLAIGGFFSAVFLDTLTGWWRWDRPGVALFVVSMVISALVGVTAYLLLGRRAAVGVAATAYLVLLIDGVLGTPMQVGSMFADGPVVGGRFFGFGNSTFAVLAVGTLVLAAAVGNRLVPRSPRYAALAVLVVGGAGIVVDGLPGWGTDFGGVIALTPAVLLLACYAWRGRVTLRAVLALGLTGFAAVALLAYADYRRPPQDRTHFGAFVQRVVDGDAWDVIVRKLGLSLRFFANPSGWVLLVVIAVAAVAIFRPARVPWPAYRRWMDDEPLNRPALLAGALCGLVGMLLNDVGVILPSIMLGFAVPLLVAHLVGDERAR